jgi:hypothetical protein
MGTPSDTSQNLADQLAAWFGALSARPLPEDLLSVIDQLERSCAQTAEAEG